MRLLLDEHYGPQIGAQLRELGHDAITASEAELAGAGDEELLSAAAAQGRALVTNNARHFVPLARRWAAEGRSHAGVLLTADASLPRGEQAIGMYVAVLGKLARDHSDEEALRDQVRWLRPPQE